MQRSKCIPINLKGTPMTFNWTFEGFYAPTAANVKRICHFLTKTAIWDLKHDHRKNRVYKSRPILVLNVIIISFRLLWMHFDHGKNKIQTFNLWPLPEAKWWVWGDGTVWRPNSKTFRELSRVYLFKRSHVEHVLTKANLKLQPSLFTPRPNIYALSNLIFHRMEIQFWFFPDVFSNSIFLNFESDINSTIMYVIRQRCDFVLHVAMHQYSIFLFCFVLFFCLFVLFLWLVRSWFKTGKTWSGRPDNDGYDITLRSGE